MKHKFSIEDLEILADKHENAARVAEAKAKEHLAAGAPERTLYTVQIKRRDSGLFYAFICREAATRLRTRAARAEFTPPTIEEVNEYASKIGWPLGDAAAWFDHFQSNGWRVNGKTRMNDWKAAARNGHRRWKDKMPSQSKMMASKKIEEPMRWKQFLASLKLPYSAYVTALPHLKTAFEEWLKKNP